MNEKKQECSNCNRKISNNLKLCPYCGAFLDLDLKKKNRNTSLILIVVIIVVFLLIANGLYTSNNDKNINEPQYIEIESGTRLINTSNNDINEFVNNLIKDLNQNLFLINLSDDGVIVDYIGDDEVKGEYLFFRFRNNISCFEISFTYDYNNEYIMQDFNKLLNYSVLEFSQEEIELIKTNMNNNNDDEIIVGNYKIEFVNEEGNTLYIRCLDW